MKRKANFASKSRNKYCIGETLKGRYGEGKGGRKKRERKGSGGGFCGRGGMEGIGGRKRRVGRERLKGIGGRTGIEARKVEE